MRNYLPAALLAACVSFSDAAVVKNLARANQASNCQRSDISAVDRLLSLVPQAASTFCYQVVHIATPLPSTATATARFTAQATATVTVAVTDATTTTTTTTANTVVAVTSTVTSTVPGATQTTTVTVTMPTADPVVKKREVVDRRAVVTPDAFKGMAMSLASEVCSCFVTTPPPTTTTVSVTATATATVQVSSHIVQTVTVVSTVTATQLTTAFTTISTTSPPSTVTATSTVYSPKVSYTNQNLPDSSCTYNRYTDGFEVDNSPDNNYQVGVDQCEGYCTARSDCEFFFYLRFDPARARGADYGYCFIDNQPYDSSYLQCGYPTQFDAGYNKNQ